MRLTLRASMTPRTLLLAVFIAVQTALLWRVAAREQTVSAPQFHYRVVTAPPAALQVIAPQAPLPPQAPPAATRPSCPPPRTDAAPAPQSNLPRGISHVTTSPTNAGWLAAWSADKVLVSIDAGRTFTQVLDGPGTVEDVTFDCFGHPIALRDARVGIRDNGKEMWRDVPGIVASDDNTGSLIGGGPDVITLGRARDDDNRGGTLAISADLGTSWWYRTVSSYWDETTASGHQDADGTIHLVVRTADCMSSPSTWIVIAPDGHLEQEDLGDPGIVRLYDDYAIAGWGPMKWKRFREKTWHDIKGLDTDANLLGGPLPRGVSDGVLYTIDHGHAQALRPWPFGSPWGAAAAVDRAGRLFGIAETKDGEDAWLVAVPSARAPIPPPSSQNE